MNSETLSAWVGLYNNDLQKVWSNEESKELKTAAAVLFALKKEFNRVQSEVEKEICQIRDQIKERQKLERKNRKKALLSLKTKSPEFIAETPKTPPKSSPNDNLQNINFSDTDNIAKSPIINRKTRNHYNKRKDVMPSTSLCFLSGSPHESSNESTVTQSKNGLLTECNQDNEDVCDISIIEGTPEFKPKKSKSSKASSKISLSKTNKSKNKTKNTITLTQLLKDSSFKKDLLTSSKDTFIKNCDTSGASTSNVHKKTDTTKTDAMDTSNINDSLLFKKKDARKSDDSLSAKKDTSDTFIDLTTTDEGMGITKIIDYINRSIPYKDIKKSENSCSKTASDDETYIEMEVDNNAPQKKFVEPIFKPGPKVLGHARKKLPGWSCLQCKRFYECQNLTEEEKRQKMNECSKHRSNYKPDDETMPGFWDLTIPASNK